MIAAVTHATAPRIPRGWKRVRAGALIRAGDMWWPSRVVVRVTVGERFDGIGVLLRRDRTAPGYHTANSRRLRDEARDSSVPLRNCRSKAERIDLGLAILSAVREPGAEFTLQEIAIWSGCTRSMIGNIATRALAKVANSLRFGRHRGAGKELS